jgi:hypothetical protein
MPSRFNIFDEIFNDDETEESLDPDDTFLELEDLKDFFDPEDDRIIFPTLSPLLIHDYQHFI